MSRQRNAFPLWTVLLALLAGITESGRMRVNTNICLRNEIIRSLFWVLSFYSTFDNRPPQGVAEEDYGIVTSIGAIS